MLVIHALRQAKNSDLNGACDAYFLADCLLLSSFVVDNEGAALCDDQATIRWQTHGTCFCSFNGCQMLVNVILERSSSYNSNSNCYWAMKSNKIRKSQVGSYAQAPTWDRKRSLIELKEWNADHSTIGWV